jgi:HK97 family phage portal protein
MELKVGKLFIQIGKKSDKLVAGRTLLNLFGFSFAWLSESSLTYVRNGYAGNPDIYTAVNKVARTASYAPFKVYRIKDKAKHLKYKMWTGQNATPESIKKAMQIKALTYEEDNDHPLNKLIEHPNKWQNSREFTESCIGFKLITGERMIRAERLTMGANEGNPYCVYNLPPQCTSVKGDGSLLGVKSFVLNVGSPEDIPAEEVVFSRYFNPDYTSSGGHLRGLSPWKAGCKLLTISNSSLRRTGAMLDNAGAAGIIFNKDDREMTVEQASKLKGQMTNEVLDPENANSIAVANGDMGYINFGLKGSEMELQAGMKLTMARIASILNVPPVLLLPDHAALNNLKEAKKELITAACFPELDSMRDDWNAIAKLYLKEGEENDIWVDYDPMVYPELQEDMEKMVGIAERAWWLKPNEKRVMMYQDEDGDNPMMNEYIIPSGLMLMNDLGMSDVDKTLNEEDDEERA